ncbi:hypothetical protein [Polaribacter sp.]|uniref:hypothetical protein n=1 Tax=Polaribacter sp. TaxID=1920175 RepID=UPI0025F4FBDA|nr:hypothetical protein [Polaribacter sp.]
MTKLWKFFQYGYLIVAIICLIEGIVRFNSEREKAYLLLGFSIFITLVFFFKRHFRKKVEKRNKQQK